MSTKSCPKYNPETKPVKPSDAELINVIAIHYNVQEITAIGWIANMDLGNRVNIGDINA